MAPRLPGARDKSQLSAAENYFAATPHDSNNEASPSTGGIYVGGAGNLTVVRLDGGQVTFTGVAAGTYLPVVATRVRSAGLTASAIVFLVAKGV